MKDKSEKAVGMKKFLAVVMVLAVLTACAANPHVVEVSNGNEQTMSCATLASEIEGAQHYKKESRKDDRFQLRYMMPLNAIASVWNINKAEMAADKRLKLLNQISSEKGCNGAMPNQAFSPGVPEHGFNGYAGEQIPASMRQPLPPLMPTMGGMGQGNASGSSMYAAPAPLQVNGPTTSAQRYRPRNNPNGGYREPSEVMPWQQQQRQPQQMPMQPQMPTGFSGQSAMGGMPGGIGSGGFGSADDAALAEKAFQHGRNFSEEEMAEMKRKRNEKGAFPSSGSDDADMLMPPPPAYSRELQEKIMRESASPYGSAPHGMVDQDFDPTMSGF